MRYSDEVIERAKDEVLARIRNEFDRINFIAEDTTYEAMRKTCEARLDETLSHTIAFDERLSLLWLAKLGATCMVQMIQIMEPLDTSLTGESNGLESNRVSAGNAGMVEVVSGTPEAQAVSQAAAQGH